MRTSDNVIEMILNRNYTQGRVTIEGFKMLDITFQSNPYYYGFDINGKLQKNKSNFYGYYFYINGQLVFINEQGKFHIESDTLMDITSLNFNSSDDVAITYAASFFKESSAEIDETSDMIAIEQDARYTVQNLLKTANNYTVNTNLLSDITCGGFSLEAIKGVTLKLNNSTIIIVGDNEYFNTGLDMNLSINNIKYLGIFDFTDYTRGDDISSHLDTSIRPDLHFYLYT